MININITMLQDKAIEVVTAIEDPKITFVGKKGMTLEFTSDDEARAAEVAKKTLKATPDFKAMYFQVVVK